MEVRESEFLPDYQVYVAPIKSIIGEFPIEWAVNIFDEDGTFVVSAGKLVSLGDDKLRYTDSAGWSRDFDSADEAYRELQSATFEMDKSKLN